jgi:predicted transcriptional regulator
MKNNEKLKVILEKSKLSRKQVSVESGIKYSTLCSYINNFVEISLDSLLTIEKSIKNLKQKEGSK